MTKNSLFSKFRERYQEPITTSCENGDQIDFLGDVDLYYFLLDCPSPFTVQLNSMSNDYDLGVSGGP